MCDFMEMLTQLSGWVAETDKCPTDRCYISEILHCGLGLAAASSHFSQPASVSMTTMPGSQIYNTEAWKD